MQRTTLAAVQATAERLIAPRYLMGQMYEGTSGRFKNETSVLLHLKT